MKQHKNTITEETNVLVLCAGGGNKWSPLLNALNKAAAEYNVPVKAAAGGYGAHREMLPEFDLVILAPQVASNFEDMKAETDKLGIKLHKTEGAQNKKLVMGQIRYKLEGSIKARDCETVSYHTAILWRIS